MEKSLVIEISFGPRGRVSTVLSVPGRDGTLSRTWYTPPGAGGLLSPGQRDDLVGYVTNTVGQFLDLLGSQPALPGL